MSKEKVFGSESGMNAKDTLSAQRLSQLGPSHFPNGPNKTVLYLYLVRLKPKANSNIVSAQFAATEFDSLP